MVDLSRDGDEQMEQISVSEDINDKQVAKTGVSFHLANGCKELLHIGLGLPK